MSTAVSIAAADDASVQQVLQNAYEDKVLRERRLIMAKRIVEQRRRRGKGQSLPAQGNVDPAISIADARSCDLRMRYRRNAWSSR